MFSCAVTQLVEGVGLSVVMVVNDCYSTSKSDGGQ